MHHSRPYRSTLRDSWSTSSRSVLCGPGCRISGDPRDRGASTLWASAPVPTTTFRADILASHVRTISESAEPLKWERGTYRLSELIVLRPVRAATRKRRATAIRDPENLQPLAQ